MAKARMGRPPLPPDQRRVTLVVRVRPATVERIAAAAERLDLSKGQVVDQAVEAWKR